MNLNDLGWDPFFAQPFEKHREQGLAPARVALEHRNAYLVYSERGELTAEASGRLRHEARSMGDLPAVGDWVAITPRPEEQKATIHAVLPRRGRFSRKAPGATTDEQVLAANVDTAFLVSGLDGDFNVRRIERYLTVAWEAGANPAIVLNKADLCPEVASRVAEVEEIAQGVPIHPVSATQGHGLEALEAYLVSGKTVALLGSSGVGKSSLINRFLGAERQEVQAVREDDSRGRHCTTCRELILLPGRGLLVDTPGMRELQVWADEPALGEAFGDIEELAARCRFRDCSHQGEPGCAVQAAIEGGTLDAGRLRNYAKLQRELRHLASRQNHKARLAEKVKWKKIATWAKQRLRDKRGEGGR